MSEILGYRVVRTRDHHVLPRGYYAPIPDDDELTPDVWEHRSALAGIDFDLERQLAFVRDELGPLLAEWTPRRHGEWGDGEFYLENRSYQSVDAETLYAMVRRLRPQRIVELGSGFTSLAVSAACRRNAADGAAPESYRVFDPFPRGNVPDDADWPTSLEPVRAQDVPLDVFTALGEDDVLVVDTTHTVKMGGDVNRIVLDVLPHLRPGVVVHFHDIWLPYEYHPQLVAETGFWAEQYLLQAYLAENPRWRVLFGAQALLRSHRDELEQLIPSLAGSPHQPTAFWLRRLAV